MNLKLIARMRMSNDIKTNVKNGIGYPGFGFGMNRSLIL
jgi:hypothetical protein